MIVKASNNHQGAARVEQWITAAQAAVDRYDGHPAAAFTDLAAEIATEVRLLRAIDTELAVHAAERARCAIDGPVPRSWLGACPAWPSSTARR